MRKLIALMMIVASFNAMAIREDVKQACKTVSGVSKSIMQLRQAGTPMSEVLEKLPSDYFHSLVIEAYEKPLWSTEKNKRQEILNFEDAAFLKCVKKYQALK